MSDQATPCLVGWENFTTAKREVIMCIEGHVELFSFGGLVPNASSTNVIPLPVGMSATVEAGVTVYHRRQVAGEASALARFEAS